MTLGNSWVSQKCFALAGYGSGFSGDELESTSSGGKLLLTLFPLTTLTGCGRGEINNPRWDCRDMISQFALRNQIYDLSQARGRAGGSFREITVLAFLALRVQKKLNKRTMRSGFSSLLRMKQGLNHRHLKRRGT